MNSAVASPSRFVAQGTLPLDALRLQVQSLGALASPLSPVQAQALHALSTPAPFGLRERTLLDASVRHSGEVAPERLTLDWAEGAWAGLEHQVARGLGVARIQAHLHNLLVYGPGQFFKPHQDTEKYPGMVATLVLIWPSAHIGGDLCVRLGQQETHLASQHLYAQDLRWFAFYADCQHEVLPVQEGWRVALTFDVVLPADVDAWAPPVPATKQQGLEAALRQLFALDSDAPRQQPWVLLLDHEYTEHGLRWPLLKGIDRHRVAALRAAALAQGLHVHLALMALHEVWTAVESDEPGRRRRSRWDDDALDADSAAPDELIDSGLSLDFWVDAQGQVGPHGCISIEAEDTLSFTDTGENFLESQEYEGYMGNYGNTLDYWYRRAALVIQSAPGAEATRYQRDFDGALADLLAQARQPDQPNQVLALAPRVQAAMSPLRDALPHRGRELLPTYAELALALPPALGLNLMRGFNLTDLHPEHAPALVALEQRHGTPWLRELWQVWDRSDGQRSLWINRDASAKLPRVWPDALPAFVRACLQAGLSHELLGERAIADLAALERLERAILASAPVGRLAVQAPHLAAVVELAQALSLLPSPSEPVRALIDQVLARPALYPPTALVPLVQALGAAARQWPQPASLHTQVEQALREALAEPLRLAADRSLRGITWVCRCADCLSLIRWAESPEAQPLVLAMAQQRRTHVETQVAASAAPLRTETRTQGRPYSLVLHKPTDLQERERQQRLAWEQALAQLQG